MTSSNVFGKGLNFGDNKKPGTAASLFGRTGSVFGGATWPSQPEPKSLDEIIAENDFDDDSAGNEYSDGDEIPIELLSVPAETINDVNDYIKVVFKYLAYRDWTASVLVAPLLSLDDTHVWCSFLQIKFPAVPVYPNVSPEDALLYELISGHLTVLYYVKKQDWLNAFAMQSAIVTLYREQIVVKEKQSNWFIPLAYVLGDDLWGLGRKAEVVQKRLNEGNNDSLCLDRVLSHITSLYQTCTRDSRLELNESKKAGIFQLTLLLLQIYFATNKMALLKPLIRAIDILSPTFRLRLSTSDLVSYNFFLGKKAMFDSDLKMADKALEYAFTYCPEQYLENKRRILVYWIPVKMFLGEIPLDGLLDDYGLSEFKAIANGVREGNIRQLREGIMRNRQFLMKSGVYLMFEKLALSTYYALFKRLAGILNSTKIKIEAFQCLLTFLGEDIQHIDEVVCIISNLIAKKKVRGYISKVHNLVVLSSKKPFED